MTCYRVRLDAYGKAAAQITGNAQAAGNILFLMVGTSARRLSVRRCRRHKRRS
jgi:hypothetical protein